MIWFGLRHSRHAARQRCCIRTRFCISHPPAHPDALSPCSWLQLLWLVEVLGALRALAHMYVPLRVMMSQPALMQALGALRKHQVRLLSSSIFPLGSRRTGAGPL